MTYIGMDSSDELRHWKYIKRYKGRNGKWRYVYADKNTHNSIRDDLLEYASRKDVDDIYEHASGHYTKYHEKSDNGKLAKIVKKTGIENYIKDNKQKMHKAENKAYATIYHNSISTLSKNKIEAGKKLIRSLLSNGR